MGKKRLINDYFGIIGWQFSSRINFDFHFIHIPVGFFFIYFSKTEDILSNIGPRIKESRREMGLNELILSQYQFT